VSGSLGSVVPSGAVHEALNCVVVSANETVCSATSAGFFASVGILFFIEIAIVVLAIVATVKVITNAGYSGWWILIGFVPIVGSICFLIFAFSKWPVISEVERLRAQVAHLGGRHRPGGDGGGPSRNPSGDPTSGPGSGPVTPGPNAPVGTDPESVPMPTFAQFMGAVAHPPSTRDVRSTGASPRPTEPPAGWFPSPGGPPGQLRYWDGERWTDHYS
jgi:Protein of unknown function (DUF2510)